MLKGRLVQHLYSEEGFLADVVLIEPNGDEHPVRILAKDQGTQISGDGEMIDYLNARYTPQEVCFTARKLVLD